MQDMTKTHNSKCQTSEHVYAHTHTHTHTPLHTHAAGRTVLVDVIVPALCCFFRCFYSKLDHAACLPCLPPPHSLTHTLTHTHTHTLSLSLSLSLSLFVSVFDVCTFRFGILRASHKFFNSITSFPSLLPLSLSYFVFLVLLSSSVPLQPSPSPFLLPASLFSSLNHDSLPALLSLF